MTGADAAVTGADAAAAPDAEPALTPVQIEARFQACRADPAFFVDTYGVIDDVQGDGADDPDEEAAAARAPFRLWPAQTPVLYGLGRDRRTIILKARQLGISWLVCAYVLWHCLFRPGRSVFLFSKGQREANELVRRVKALHDRLPDWLRARLPTQEGPPNLSAVRWSNGSTVQSMPATKNAGISFTASLVVLDEAAHMQFGRQLYAAVKPIVDGGGQLIVLSTANGLGGFFHNLWDKAQHGLNSFAPVFLPWRARPDRDDAWYAQVVADADDLALIPQEYPANPIEAFVASGRLRFNPQHVAAQARNVRPPLPVAAWPAALHARRFWPGLKPDDLPRLAEIPGLAVYAPPVPGRKYLIGGDVAEGRDPEGKRDSDYDAAPVIDEETWEEVACLHGRWEPDAYAGYLVALGEAYNGAVMVVERNSIGQTVLNEFRHLRVPVARVGLGPDGWPGWPTNGVTKPAGVTLLSGALRDDLITVRTAAAVAEMHTYSVRKDGTTGAASGYHDDYVSGWVVLLSYIRQQSLAPAGGEIGVDGPGARPTGYLGVG